MTISCRIGRDATPGESPSPLAESWSLDASASVEDLVRLVIERRFLPTAGASSMVWVIGGRRPLAVLADAWPEARYLVAPKTPLRGVMVSPGGDASAPAAESAATVAGGVRAFCYPGMSPDVVWRSSLASAAGGSPPVPAAPVNAAQALIAAGYAPSPTRPATAPRQSAGSSVLTWMLNHAMLTGGLLFVVFCLAAAVAMVVIMAHPEKNAMLFKTFTLSFFACLFTLIGVGVVWLARKS